MQLRIQRLFLHNYAENVSDNYHKNKIDILIGIFKITINDLKKV